MNQIVLINKFKQIEILIYSKVSVKYLIDFKKLFVHNILYYLYNLT